MSESKSVRLGFADGEFPPGTHICQVYCDDEERDRALRDFLIEGLVANEKTACFSEVMCEQMLAGPAGDRGVVLSEAQANGGLTLAGARDVYFEANRLDPERMLRLLRSFHREAEEGEFSGARVIGEMTPEIRNVEGGSNLLQYESKVSLLVREHPVTAVCQYDARAFDGATIMDVLTVHPLMVVRGAVVHNPFYVPPEEFLA